MGFFRDQGWNVVDTRLGNPYDAVATRDREVVHLEAKGTETEGAAVMVTVGEIEHARSNPVRWSWECYLVSD